MYFMSYSEGLAGLVQSLEYIRRIWEKIPFSEEGVGNEQLLREGPPRCF